MSYDGFIVVRTLGFFFHMCASKITTATMIGAGMAPSLFGSGTEPTDLILLI